MEGESGVTLSIIDELDSGDLKGDQIEDEIDVTRSIIEVLRPWGNQRDKIGGESGVTPSIIDEFLSSDIQGDQI